MTYPDIRETGVNGLKGLPGINRRPTPLDRYGSRSVNRTMRELESPAKEDVGLELARLGYGDSKYDKNIISMDQARNINEFRAQNQPWYDQIANGALKMLSTAGTTFIDGTLGTLVGIGTGLANLFDDNPNTGFWRGMWDNAISNAMADINDDMENSFKNYRTEWEENASVFERMFSGLGAANFWGDDILKNAGFTLGAAGAIWATQGAGAFLKGTQWAGKLGKLLGLLGTTEEGLQATKAGKVASWIANSFVSSQGEAAIEAVNAMRDNVKDMEYNLSIRKNALYEEAEEEYEANIANGMNPIEANLMLQQKKRAIDADVEKYRNQMQAELQDAGNITYAANIAALTASNNLTLGSLIRGGYGTSKSLLESAIKTVDGKVVSNESASEIGEGLLRGTLKFSAPELKHVGPKVAGRWLLQSTQEGLEEGVQNLASTTTQMSTQARMNKYARTNTMLGNMINPSAKEDLVDYTNALIHAYQDQFGAANSQGWTEVMAGFISGALGIPGMHRNEQGKLRPTMEGGVFEAYKEITGENKAIQAQAEKLNKALTDAKFGERTRNAIAKLAIKKAQDEALGRNDIQEFKNLEIQQLVTDAITFRNLGMLDEYLGMYKALANDVTDQDIAELKAAIKTEDGLPTALDKKTDDELKTIYSDKAKSTLNKIEEVLKNYESIEEQYGNKFSDETRGWALKHLTFGNTILWDTYRRINELEEENNSLKEKEHLTPIEQEKIKSNQKAIDSLQEQATTIRDELNEYKNSPKKLQAAVEEQISIAQKQELYKKTEEALKKYKEATTVKDVMDVFYNSPAEDREAVLKQAIEQSEGDTKVLLSNFKDFLSDANTLQGVIMDRFNLDDVEEGNSEELMRRLELIKTFNTLLNDSISDILNDDSPVLTRENLKDKLKAKLQEWSDILTEKENNSQGVSINEDGSVNFSEALDNGIINFDDNFNLVLDNPETGEDHTELIPNSRAEEMGQAAIDAHGVRELIEHLNHFIDSLDMLDDLRKAAKKKKDKSEEESNKEESKKRRAKERVVGTEEGNEGKEDTEDTEENKDKEPEEENKPRENKGKLTSPSPLSKEERKDFNPAIIKDSQGREYHTIQRKNPKKKGSGVPKSMQKKLAKADNTINLLADQLSSAKNDEERIKLLNKFFDNSSKLLFVPKIIDKLNELLSKYKHLLKPDSSKEASKEEHNNKEGQNLQSTETSLYGNQSAEYVESELSDDKAKMVQVTRQANGKKPVQVWLRENHFNPQEIIDRYLGKILERDKNKSKEESTPVYYLHNDELPNVMFLGMKYSDVENIIPRSEVKLISTPNGDYVLIGTLGWNEDMEGTHDMYDSILEETREFHSRVSFKLDASEDIVNALNEILGDEALAKAKITKRIVSDIDEVIGEVIEENSNKNADKIAEALFEKLGLSIEIGNVKIEGKDIWNKLSNFAKDDKLKPKLSNAINKALAESSAKSTDTQVANNEWAVNTQHTNRIKDLTAGAKVKQTLSDSKSRVRDLRELVGDTATSERNPYNLNIEDLGWTVIEGTEDKPKQKYINAKEGRVYNVVGRPGQVYVHVPTSNGWYIPIYIESIFFQELDNDTPLMEVIEKHINILADPEATDAERKKAIAELTDLLIFSKQNQIHLNTSEDRISPNTIKITKNGKQETIIDFEEGIGDAEDLKNAILSVNPRVNIQVSVLARNPDLYLDSGVLTTDIGMMGTVNSKFYIYPVDDDNEWVKNKPHTTKTRISTGVVRERVYLQGRYVYFNEDHFEDASHRTIDDSDGSYQMALDIKEGRVEPIKYKDNAYFDNGSVMYTDNGHGGLVIVDSDFRDTILKAGKKGEKAKARRKKVEEENNKNEKKVNKEEKPVPNIPYSAEINQLTYKLQEIIGAHKLPNGNVVLLSTALNEINPNLSLEELDKEILKAFNSVNLGKYWNNADAYREKGFDKGTIRRAILNKTKKEEEKKSEGNKIDITLSNFIKKYGQGSIRIYPLGKQVGALNLTDHLSAYREALNLINKFKSCSTHEELHDSLASTRSLTVNDWTYLYTFFDMFKRGEINEADISKLIIPESYREENLDNKFKFNQVQSVKEERKTSSSNNNDDKLSAEEIEKRESRTDLLSVLAKRENETKADELYDLVNDTFGTDAEEDEDLIKVLEDNNIDISSNDIDTIADIIRSCR